MKKEDIYNGITDIRDDLVEKAGERRKSSRPWRAAVAACLAVVLVAGGTWAFFAGSGKRMDHMTGNLGGDMQQGNAMPPYNGGQSAENSAPSGETSRNLALVTASFPEAVPYPADGLDTDAWSEYQRAHRVDTADAEALRSYLDAAIPEFLTVTDSTNPVCSPVNVFEALAMLTETANGETRAQLLDLLGAHSIEDLRALTNRVVTNLYNDDGAETVRLSSSLWLREDRGYNMDTLRTLASDYYASVYAGTPGTGEMDAALRDWLNAGTGGLLKDSVDAISMDPDTAAALAATVYFSAKWDRQFSEAAGDTRVFHTPSGDVKREFMNGVFTQDYYPGDGFTGVELSFKLGGSMRLLLPDEGVSPQELLTNADALDFLLSADLGQREGREAEIRLSLPKFDVTGNTDLSSALRSLGVTDVFEPGMADLSNLAAGAKGEIWVSRVLHGARVKVDEEGCEAAAYTYIEAPGAAMPPEDPGVVEIVLDRPFLFSVMEEGLPLFTGIVNEP